MLLGVRVTVELGRRIGVKVAVRMGGLDDAVSVVGDTV